MSKNLIDDENGAMFPGMIFGADYGPVDLNEFYENGIYYFNRVNNGPTRTSTEAAAAWLVIVATNDYHGTGCQIAISADVNPTPSEQSRGVELFCRTGYRNDDAYRWFGWQKLNGA